MICAAIYVRTSSVTNIDGDSVPRQRAACEAYASRAGVTIRAEFADMAVKGADRIDARAGFLAMLAWCQEHDCKTIIVENASRFARDLIVQETGFHMLRSAGYTLIAADDPDAFTASTPTQDLIRQVLGAVAQFEKANLVGKLKAARDRKSAETGRRIEGLRCKPEHVAAVRDVGMDMSYRKIAAALAERGIVTASGKHLSPDSIRSLVREANR